MSKTHFVINLTVTIRMWSYKYMHDTETHVNGAIPWKLGIRFFFSLHFCITWECLRHRIWTNLPDFKPEIHDFSHILVGVLFRFPEIFISFWVNDQKGKERKKKLKRELRTQRFLACGRATILVISTSTITITITITDIIIVLRAWGWRWILLSEWSTCTRLPTFAILIDII